MATQFDNTYATATLTDNTTGITYSFPFNVNALNWTYQMNTSSYSTIGGRVTQLLSTRVNTIFLQGEAGSRDNLLTLYGQFKTMQDNQNLQKTSMTLSIPSQSLTMNVWLEQMQIGWGVDTVTYMYNMAFEADGDLSSSSQLTTAAVNDALNRITTGIGFNADYVGLTTQTVNLSLSGG
jgi:hypothetical protein